MLHIGRKICVNTCEKRYWETPAFGLSGSRLTIKGHNVTHSDEKMSIAIFK